MSETALTATVAERVALHEVQAWGRVLCLACERVIMTAPRGTIFTSRATAGTAGQIACPRCKYRNFLVPPRPA